VRGRLSLCVSAHTRGQPRAKMGTQARGGKRRQGPLAHTRAHTSTHLSPLASCSSRGRWSGTSGSVLKTVLDWDACLLVVGSPASLPNSQPETVPSSRPRDRDRGTHTQERLTLAKLAPKAVDKHNCHLVGVSSKPEVGSQLGLGEPSWAAGNEPRQADKQRDKGGDSIEPSWIGRWKRMWVPFWFAFSIHSNEQESLYLLPLFH